jgi:uncharacterized protein YbaR (Trm112 family)
VVIITDERKMIMEQACPICQGHGVIVIQRGSDPQTEDDLPCTDCGQTGRVKGSRARRLEERADTIRSQALARRFGASAHRWNVR